MPHPPSAETRSPLCLCRTTSVPVAAPSGARLAWRVGGRNANPCIDATSARQSVLVTEECWRDRRTMAVHERRNAQPWPLIGLDALAPASPLKIVEGGRGDDMCTRIGSAGTGLTKSGAADALPRNSIRPLQRPRDPAIIHPHPTAHEPAFRLFRRYEEHEHVPPLVVPLSRRPRCGPPRCRRQAGTADARAVSQCPHRR